MRIEKNWRNRTIEQLEAKNYGDPNNSPTNMIKRCIQLCKVPLKDFVAEDLRLMIGQEFVLYYLITLALEYLQKDIFIEASLYKGDLLEKILNVKTSFWDSHEELWNQLNILIKDRREEIDEEIIFSQNFEASIHSRS